MSNPFVQKHASLLLQCAAAGIAFVWVFSYQFVHLVTAWASSEDHSHGFLIIPISVYIAWKRKKSLSNLASAPSASGWFIVAGALALYVVGVKAEIHTLASLSIVLCLGGLIVYFFGARVLKAFLFPLLFLMFMIPVPSQVYAALTVPLQLLVTKVSVVLIQSLEIPAYREGNVIHLPYSQLHVVNACSGLRSMTSLLALGSLMAYLALRNHVSRGILVLSAVPISVVINIFRVSLTAALSYYISASVAEGAVHTMIGMSSFVLAFACFWMLKSGLTWVEHGRC